MNKSSSICSKRLQPKASLRLGKHTYEEIDGCYQEAREIADKARKNLQDKMKKNNLNK